MNHQTMLLVVVLLWSVAQGVLADSIDIVSPDIPGASEEGGLGRDGETVRRVLEYCGHTPRFYLQPFGRHLLTYEQDVLLDAVTTVPLNASTPGFPTAAYIWYQNGAYYDPEQVGVIRSISDLTGLRVVTFEDGRHLLELDELRVDAEEVLEIYYQPIHARLLMLGRVDVILADGLVTALNLQRVYREDSDRLSLKAPSSLVFAPIFQPSPYKMVFREASMAAEFDRCYDRARADGVIRHIDQKYISRHQESLQHKYLGR